MGMGWVDASWLPCSSRQPSQDAAMKTMMARIDKQHAQLLALRRENETLLIKMVRAACACGGGVPFFACGVPLWKLSLPPFACRRFLLCGLCLPWTAGIAPPCFARLCLPWTAGIAPSVCYAALSSVDR